MSMAGMLVLGFSFFLNNESSNSRRPVGLSARWPSFGSSTWSMLQPYPAAVGLVRPVPAGVLKDTPAYASMAFSM